MENNLEDQIVSIIQQQLESIVEESYNNKDLTTLKKSPLKYYGDLLPINTTAKRIKEIFYEENVSLLPNLSEKLVEKALNKAVLNVKMKYNLIEPSKTKEWLGVFKLVSEDWNDDHYNLLCIAGSYPQDSWIYKFNDYGRTLVEGNLYLCNFRKKLEINEIEDLGEFEFNFISEVKIEDMNQAIKELGVPKCVDNE